MNNNHHNVNCAFKLIKLTSSHKYLKYSLLLLLLFYENSLSTLFKSDNVAKIENTVRADARIMVKICKQKVKSWNAYANLKTFFCVH